MSFTKLILNGLVTIEKLEKFIGFRTFPLPKINFFCCKTYMFQRNVFKFLERIDSYKHEIRLFILANQIYKENSLECGQCAWCLPQSVKVFVVGSIKIKAQISIGSWKHIFSSCFSFLELASYILEL